MLTTAITLDDPTASLRLAYEVASYFRLTPKDARAAKLRLSQAEIDRMASAFEHEDLKAAVGIRATS